MEKIEILAEKIDEINNNAYKAGMKFAEAEDAINRLAKLIQEWGKSLEGMTEEFREAKRLAESTITCRVCGKHYMSKAEAKACMRSHNWQNKRGRR